MHKPCMDPDHPDYANDDPTWGEPTMPCRDCGAPRIPAIETAHDLAAYVMLGILCGTCYEAQERARETEET